MKSEISKKESQIYQPEFPRIYNFDLNKTIDFVLKRKHKNGGFGIAPSVPPSIQDTYYALNILNPFVRLSKDKFNYSPLLDEQLKIYLNSYSLEKENLSFRLLFYHLASCNLIGLKPAWSLEYIMSLKYKLMNLEDKFYAKKILKEFYAMNIDWKIKEGWRTIKELYMSLYINDGMINGIDKRDIIQWINACQNPDGGFGFLPNSTSFIENTYFSLSCFLLLKESPDYITKISDFVFSCYTGKGGFSRKDGGAPLLDATYYAIKCLLLLKELNK